MNKIGSSYPYRKFTVDTIKKMSANSSLLYDITSIPSYSHKSVFEYGYAKDLENLKQVNFSMVMEKERRIQLYYEMYPGSIPDVVTMKRTIDYLSPFISDMKIILDRVFFLF